MSDFILFGLISALCIVAICGAAWIFVIRYTLLNRMAKIETDGTRLAVFETRLNEILSKPDVSSAAIKTLGDDISLIRSEIKGIKRDADQTEEALRRLINKMTARARRGENEEEKKPTAESVNPVPAEQTDILAALKAQGIAVPVGVPSAPPPQIHNNSFGRVAQ